MKSEIARMLGVEIGVAPVRERGLKSEKEVHQIHPKGRSREGAWIEISVRYTQPLSNRVAPVRERGLK